MTLNLKSKMLICTILATYAVSGFGNAISNDEFEEGDRKWSKDQLSVTAPNNPQTSLSEKSTNKINGFFNSLNYQEKRYRRLHKVHASWQIPSKEEDALYHSLYMQKRECVHV